MRDPGLGLSATSAASKPPSPLALDLGKSMKDIFLDIQRNHGGQVPAFSKKVKGDGMRVKYINAWYSGLATKPELDILRNKASDMGQCRLIVANLDNLVAAQIKNIFTLTGDRNVPDYYQSWGGGAGRAGKPFTSSSSTLENFLKNVKKRDKGKDLIDSNFPISDTAKLAQSLAAFRQRHGAGMT